MKKKVPSPGPSPAKPGRGAKTRSYVFARKRAGQFPSSAGATISKTMRAREFRRESTPAEKMFWAVVRRDGLGAPCRRQHVIEGWIVDFYVPAAALVIELDGEIHQNQIEKDFERDAALRSLGLEVVRIRNDEVEQNLPDLIRRLTDLIHQRQR